MSLCGILSWCGLISVPPLSCQLQAQSGEVKSVAPGPLPAVESAPSGGGVNMARAPNTFRMHRCHLSWLTTAPLSAIWVYYQYISPHIMMFSLALVLWDQLQWKTAAETSRWQGLFGGVFWFFFLPLSLFYIKFAFQDFYRHEKNINWGFLIG